MSYPTNLYYTPQPSYSTDSGFQPPPNPAREFLTLNDLPASRYTVFNGNYFSLQSTGATRTQQLVQITLQNVSFAVQEIPNSYPLYSYLPMTPEAPRIPIPYVSSLAPGFAERASPAQIVNSSLPPPFKRPNPNLLADRPNKKSAFTKKAKKADAPQVLSAPAPAVSSNWRALLVTGTGCFHEKKYEEGFKAFRECFEIYRTKLADDTFCSTFLSSCRPEIANTHAIRSAELGLILNPKDTNWLFLKGLCNIAPTKYEKAVQSFQNILDQNPNDRLVQLMKKSAERFLEREVNARSNSHKKTPKGKQQ